MRNLLVVVGLAIVSFGCHRGKAPKELYFSGEPVAHWLELAQSPDPKSRKKAIDILGNVGPADPAAIPALIAAVKDKDASVRAAAVLALSKIGPPAAEANAALQEATRDSNPAVRNHAAKAIERVTGKS